MSAEIDSLERKAVSGTENSMEEAIAAVNELKIESDESDPVDFLLSNSKYHDCFLTVGNPETDEIERIGVISAYLIANSQVFENMLDSYYRQTDLPHAEIVVSDVSPATFKLMLRYLYGGDLPKMTAIEIAGLALYAEKYKITRLVQETFKRLTPTSAEDVFPALICVTYTSFPDLEVQVCKIIQQEIENMVENADFLKLDEACVLFILKQETLNIDEVELWRHVVRWAEHQVETNPARTVRDCLVHILGYVRFLTFTSEEILEHVLPTEALTPEEFVDLARAVTKKQKLQSSVLCNIQKARDFYEEEEVKTQTSVDTLEKTIEDIRVLQNNIKNKPESIMCRKLCVFKASDYCKVESKDELSYFSSLNIIPCKSIEIESFICKRRSGQVKKKYNYKCKITINKLECEGRYQQKICVDGYALSNGDVVLPLKFNNGKPIVMDLGEEWKFDLSWDHRQPVHDLVEPDDVWGDVVETEGLLLGENMEVSYNMCFHVIEIAYKKR